MNDSFDYLIKQIEEEDKLETEEIEK